MKKNALFSSSDIMTLLRRSDVERLKPQASVDFSQLLDDVERVAKMLREAEDPKEKKARIRQQQKLYFETNGYDRPHESFKAKTLPQDTWIGDTEL